MPLLLRAIRAGVIKGRPLESYRPVIHASPQVFQAVGEPLVVDGSGDSGIVESKDSTFDDTNKVG